MKAITIIALAVVFNYVVVRGKSLPSGNNKQTCPRKQLIKNLCDNVKLDMGALSNKINMKMGKSKTLPKTRSMFSTFATVKKLGQNKIVERLYFFHNILGDGYGFFGKKKAYQKMKAKTINIVIQIKALAEILQNNTNCNPGKPGHEFQFDLPQDKPLSAHVSGFLYHFAALLQDMKPEFEKNVIKQLKFV